MMYKSFKDDKDEPKKGIMDDISFLNMMSMEAIINLLVKKGVCTKEEVMAETQKVKERWELMKDMNLKK